MAGKYALELDHEHAGWLVSPGDRYLDVDPLIRRKEGVFGLHPGTHRGFWAWVEGSPYGERRDGAILVFDAEGREVERLEFHDATVSELGMPALDAAHAKPGALSLRIQIKAAEIRAGGTASTDARGDAVPIAGCRLQLAGAEPSTHGVHTIEAFTLRTQPGRHPYNSLQRIVLAVDPGAAWDEALVGRHAALEYLAADATSVLVRIEFKVAGVRAATMATRNDRPGRTLVELACRELQFALEPAPGPE